MLRPWNVPIQIETGSHLPIYQQIAASVIAEIERGRLKPGTALPGTRALSRDLGVNRNTVTTAFEELIAQGWVTAESSRGTFVKRRLPRLVRELPATPSRQEARRSASPHKGPQAVERSHAPRFNFADEGPDARVDATKDLDDVFRRVSRDQFSNGWTRCDPRGTLSLRESIAEMLRVQRGVLVDSDSLMVTRGRQMALYLCAQAALKPGDVVAVEQPGQKRVWETFRAMGARVVGVPVDDQGLQVEFLKRLAKSHPIRAVYVTPAHQFPTAITMSGLRRRELLRWADETGTLILEDDFHHDNEYDGPCPLSLASQDRSDSVVYIGSFSRLTLPGAHLGYIATTHKRVRRMAQMRSMIDLQGDTVLETAVAQLMCSGRLSRRVTRTTSLYRERRDVLAGLLHDQFGDAARVLVPKSGSALWLQPCSNVNTQSWSEAALELGLRVNPASSYWLDGSVHGGIRLSFTSMSEQEMECAVRVLAQSCPVRVRLSQAS